MHFKWEDTGIGKIDNLGKQLQKALKNVNKGSFETRYRYLDAEKRFIKHVAEKYNLQNLSNVKDKHLESYVKELQAKGKADKYIKTELSGIRFIHNQVANTQPLMDSVKFNTLLDLKSTKDGRTDRAWTYTEYKKMIEVAHERNRPDISQIIIAIKNTGMRLDEACTVKRHQIEEALRTGTLHLTNTKGAREREISLTDSSMRILEKVIKDVPRGGYVFTPQKYWAKNIHKYETSVQNFINYHRTYLQESDRSNSAHNVESNKRGALTIHGLRHTYAKIEFKRLREQLPEREARRTLSNELGHDRESVTQIYVPNK